jgi:TPR repeat protein
MKNLMCLLMLTACTVLLFSSEKSIDTLIQEAEQGDAEAQFNLGMAYKYGEDISLDYTEAVIWFRKAADQGYADAQNGLGVMYAEGKGVKQDYTEAVKWFRKAAEQGEIGAQLNLNFMYHDGQGVPKDDVSAYMWLKIAVSNGAKGAANALESLATKMSSDDVGEAQRRAQICLESNYKQCD